MDAETFRRERAATPEPFTGERLTGAVEGQIAAEHYARYLFARGLVAGRTVLDIACGEGYGTALLAQVATEAVGADIAAATILHARRQFPRPNLRFLAADARALPFPAGQFDAVVSFETIEHVPDPEACLDAFARVLAPGGLLVVSTPDRASFAALGVPANPHHHREMDAAEFTAALRARFRHVALARQQALSGAAILPDGGGLAPVRVVCRIGEGFTAGPNFPLAPYVIALASNTPLPPLPALLLVEEPNPDTERLRRVAAERDAAALAARLATLEGSTLWRATAVLRALGRRHPRLARTLRRIVRG